MIVSPAASLGRNSFFCSSDPISMMGIAPPMTVGMKGPGTRARPNSSSRMMRSTNVIPLPPYSGGMTSPCQPCSAIFCQSSGE